MKDQFGAGISSMKSPPKTLYKYFGPKAADHTFGKAQLRLSRAHLLNDPFEFMHRFDDLSLELTNESIWTEFSSSQDSQRLQEIVRREELDHGLRIQKRFGNRYGFLCMCARIDSPAMWGLYTDDHTGFGVGFNTAHGFFKNDGNLLFDMEYADERPQFTESENLMRLLQVKSSEWTHEQEWRLYRDFGKAAEDIDDWKYCPFPFPAVSHLYFGFRASEPLIAKITDSFAKQGVGVPPRFRMLPHRTEFKLEPFPL